MDLKSVVFWGLVTVLIMAPLPLGSNRLWSWSILGIVVGCLTVLWALGVFTGKIKDRVRWGILIGPIVLYGLVLAWIAIQGACWVPESWTHETWRLLDQHSATGSPEVCAFISVHPFSTWTGLGRLLTYAMTLLLVVGLTHRPDRARKLLRVLAISITGYSAYGLVLYFIGSETILWLDKWAYLGVVTSTFVNRNAFAVFAGMGVVLNTAIVAHACLKAWEDSERQQSLRLIYEALVTRLPVYVAGSALCMIALVLSASRAGLVATLCGLIVLIVLVSIGHGLRLRRGLLVVMAVGGVLLAMVAMGGSHLVDRMSDSGSDALDRETVISETLAATLDHPWTGVGHGTFEHAWTMYRPPSVRLWFRQAHSTYAEGLFELGVPAALVLWFAVAWLLWICLIAIAKRRGSGIYCCVALGASSIPILHSTIDFSLQNPAIVMLMCALLGMGIAQATAQSQR